MKQNYLVFLVLAICFSCQAQKLGKVKGNKEVIDVYQDLEDFTALEISNGLEVSIKQAATNDYHLETDSNLVEEIVFENLDGKLHIYANSMIQSSKKLNISLNLTNLDMITLNDGAELSGLNKITSTTIDLFILDKSEFNLDIEADTLKIIMNDDSKGELATRGGKANITLNENSTLKGDMTMTSLSLEINERSDFDMDGDVENLDITAIGSAKIKGSVLRALTANVTASENSEIYLNATKALTLYMQEKSTVYLYGNPEITIEGFKDSSRLIKKR